MSTEPEKTQPDFMLDVPQVDPFGHRSDTVSAANPIADLSYRNYTGPLNSHTFRWWVVALAGIRAARQKKGFWAIAGVSVLPYLFSLIGLYLQSRMPVNVNNPITNNTVGQKYASSFFQLTDFNLFMMFVMTLMVGSGSISADNRSNALLVYLSKPLTKVDYLIGKWMGIFTTLFAVALAPALILYIYCIMTFWSDGIFHQEPWLLTRVLLACALPAALHASLMVGFSAWCKTPRVAGAIYAGFYFFSGIVSGIIWMIRTHGNMSEQVLLRHISVSGLMRGMVQNVYNVTDKVTSFGSGMPSITDISAPSAKGVFLISLIVGGIGIMAARARIRAVEVVTG